MRARRTHRDTGRLWPSSSSSATSRALPSSAPSRRPESRHGRLRAGRPLAETVAGHGSLARRVDVGVGRRRVGGESGQGLGDAARRDFAAARRRTMDLRLPAEPAPDQHRQARLFRNAVPLSDAPAPPGLRRGRHRQHDRGVAPARQIPGAAARHRARRDGPRAAQDPDESLRSRKTHLDRRRRHARDQHLHATTASW